MEVSNIPDPDIIWNIILSIIVWAVVWWIRGLNDRISETTKEIHETRERMLTQFALKSEMERDYGRIMNRFDMLEEKLEKYLDAAVALKRNQ